MEHHAESCLSLAKEHPVSIGAYVEPWCQYLRATILSSLGRFHEVSRIVRTQFELQLLGRNLPVLPPLSVLAAFVLPGLGQLDEAERIVRESWAAWRSDEVTVQDLNLLLAVSLLSRYRRDALSGWREFRALWTRIDASLMPRTIMGPLMNGMGGTLAAAAAQETTQKSERGALLREATRMLTRAASSGSRAARLSARTQLACLAGDRRTAVRYLREVLGLPHLSPVVEHAATRHLGTLLGGAEGSSQVARADAWFQQRGVADAERLSAVLMPGPDFL